MKVVLVARFGSSEELIAQIQLPRSRTPCQARKGAILGYDQILEMFAHRTAVDQVMITFQQMGEEVFTLSSSHQADFQGLQ